MHLRNCIMFSIQPVAVEDPNQYISPENSRHEGIVYRGIHVLEYVIRNSSYTITMWLPLGPIQLTVIDKQRKPIMLNLLAVDYDRLCLAYDPRNETRAFPNDSC
jgi:hypothetical protein